jgi:hypothetical protein
MEPYKQPPPKDGFIVSQSFWSRPAVRFGFTFIFGVFAGFMIFSFIKADIIGPKTSTSEMKGTLYNSGSFDNMKTADVIQYESALVKAVYNVRYSTQIVEIRVELSSTDAVKSTIEFDYNNFSVLNVQNVSVNGESGAMAAGNLIQINNTGSNKFIFQLLNKNRLSHNLDVKIYQNDSPVYQNSIQVNKE